MGSLKRCESCGVRRGWRRVDGKRKALARAHRPVA